MLKKTQEQFEREVYDLTNGEYTVVGVYKSAKDKILIRHNCKECNNCEWEVTPNMFLGRKTRCPICLSKKPAHNKTTFEQANEYIESYGCKLITTEFISIYSKLLVQCVCGKSFPITLKKFKDGKHKCNDCNRKNTQKSNRLSIDDVKNEFIVRGYIPLFHTYSNNNEKLAIQDSEGYKYTTTLGNFKKGLIPQKISTSNPYTIDNIHKYIKLNNIDCELISTEYKGIYEELQWRCACGNIFNMAWNVFKKSEKKCFNCVRCGEKSHFWNGGISAITDYLRTCIKAWKKETMIKDNYKCVITGKKLEVIHHLYGFEMIAKEALELCNLPLYENINKYTQEELKLLEQTCVDLHKKYGLGVCLTKDIHRQFHEVYGSKGNTPEQFKEFYKNKN